MTTLSIVLLTRDGGPFLAQVLDGIARTAMWMKEELAR